MSKCNDFLVYLFNERFSPDFMLKLQYCKWCLNASHVIALLLIVQGCLWIKDKHMDELVKYDQGASEEANEANHEEKHSEL